jgi:hypothetical protein
MLRVLTATIRGVTRPLGRKTFSTQPKDSASLGQYTTTTEGNGLTKKVYVMRDGKRISPWHDIQLWTEKPGVVHMVNEIPRYLY